MENSDVLPFFHGDLQNATIYAYWVEKGEDIVDLVYFTYYPCNRGKEVMDTIWGNHVGDWEHMTVRLQFSLEGDRITYTVLHVYLSEHDHGDTRDRADVTKYEDTHPVVFAAGGSHGLYFGEGRHVCQNIFIGELADECGAGQSWNTWERMLGMDYWNHYALGNAIYPQWMRTDFTDPGIGDSSDPASGPIFRWGNLAEPSWYERLIGYERLTDGPTGPPSKDGVWQKYNFEFD